MNYSCDNLPDDDNIFYTLAPECGEGSEGSVGCPGCSRCENGKCVTVICNDCEQCNGAGACDPKRPGCFACLNGVWTNLCTDPCNTCVVDSAGDSECVRKCVGCQECLGGTCVEKTDTEAGAVSPKCRRCEDGNINYTDYGLFVTINPCKDNCGPDEDCVSDLESCECVKCPTSYDGLSVLVDVDPRCPCPPQTRPTPCHTCQNKKWKNDNISGAKQKFIVFTVLSIILLIFILFCYNC